MADSDDVRFPDTGVAGRPLQDLIRRFVGGRLFQFGLFAVNGAAVAVVYSVAVWSLIALSPGTFVLDVVVAYAIASVANYTGSRLVFKPVTTPRAHLPRYVSVLVGNFVLTAGLAWLLHRVGLPTLVAAYAPAVITAAPTFLLMRKWVFYSEPDVDRSTRSDVEDSEVEIPGI